MIHFGVNLLKNGLKSFSLMSGGGGGGGGGWTDVCVHNVSACLYVGGCGGVGGGGNTRTSGRVSRVSQNRRNTERPFCDI